MKPIHEKEASAARLGAAASVGVLAPVANAYQRKGSFFDPFLGFVPDAASSFLGPAIPFPAALIDRIQALVAGVDIGDINAPLPPDDDF